MRLLVGLVGLALILSVELVLPVKAQAPVEVKLAMTKDRFVPEEIRAKAGQPFVLVLTNDDDISHELDIPKLRLEKKIRAGQTIRLQMPALGPGRYDLVDDDSTPQLNGVLVVE